MPYTSLLDLRERSGLANDDLRILVKVGALDSIAGGMSRPMLLWRCDRDATQREDEAIPPPLRLSAAPPPLREYTSEKRRQTEYELLGFTTHGHPMDLFRDRLSRFRIVRSMAMHQHVGKTVLCAGMLTTSKPVSTAKDEPMEFATFDDGDGLIETVLFPDVYGKRGHVLFDKGPFLIRGKVEEEFGAITVTVLGIERVERVARKVVRGET